MKIAQTEADIVALASAFIDEYLRVGLPLMVHDGESAEKLNQTLAYLHMRVRDLDRERSKEAEPLFTEGHWEG